MKGSFERLGASLDDSHSIEAMNPDFIPKTAPKRGVPGEPITYSMAEWKVINDDMKNAVLSIAGEITGGRIVAKTSAPDNDRFHPCTDCQYKFICRNAVK